MRRKQVKTIIGYYSGIPGMVKLLNSERLDLEDEYNGLRGTSYDGMPHGSTPGKPTEELAVRMDTERTWARIQEIDVKKQVLQGDAAIIRDCLDALNSKYKSLVCMKYLNGYSWAKISVSLGVPDGTTSSSNLSCKTCRAAAEEKADDDGSILIGAPSYVASAAGLPSLTDCYIKSGASITNDVGTYEYTANCKYTN